MRTRRDFDHAVPASRRHGPLACKGGMGRVLSIEIVVLATSAAILLVRSGDLENRNPGLLHETEKACAIAAGRLYTDALQVTEGSHPGEHLAITLTGGGEASRFDDPILFVDDRCDVQILMGIDAANDATLPSFDDRHSQPPALTMHERLRRDRMRGQDSHETMKVRPFSGHRHRRGKASPQGVPGRSTGPGKDTAGRSECGSGRTGRLTAPAYQSVDRCLSQAARKLAFIL